MTQNDKKKKTSQKVVKKQKSRRRKQLKVERRRKNIEEKSLKSLRRKPNYSLKDNLRIWYYLNLPLSKFILFSVENQDFQLQWCVLPASTVYNRYLYTKNEYCIFYEMLPIFLKRILAIVHFKEICVENVWKRNVLTKKSRNGEGQ